VWVICCLAALLTVPLAGQTFYGSVVGTVTDASGGAVAAATVILTNNGTSEKRTTTTAADGNYRFVNLVPGNYRLDAAQTGFKHYTRDQIAVEVDSVVRVDTSMQVGDVSQSVEVQAAAPLIQTENASLSQIVGTRTVQEMPLNGRNVLNLVSLVPGVVMQGAADGSPTGKNVFAAGNYQIGGGTQNQSAAYYDGVPTNVTYGNLIALTPTQDAVSEFRVQTNNNTSEYGRYTGGVINIASKSGTNEIHGSAYEFLRNRVLNSANFFSNRNGQAKAAFTQNQFGVNLSGPVQKDKFFLFGSYEGYRSRQGVPFSYTVPTLAELSGDFSKYVSTTGAQIPIYDPLTQCGAYNNPACGTTVAQRSPFPGNIIPSSRINPIAKNYIAFPYWAAPNVPGQQFGNILNYFTNATTGGDNNQVNVRGDYGISAKQRVFARFTRLGSTNQQVQIYHNGLYSADPYAPEIWTTHHAVMADTYVFSPTTILDVRAGFMRWYNDRIPGTLGIDIPGKLGYPAYYKQIPVLDGVEGVQEIPSISISSPTVNNINPGPIRARDDTIVLTPTLTKIQGSHSIKFGAELRKNELNYYQNNQSGGTFAFDNLFTSPNALNSGATGSGFASFLLGLPNNNSKVQISPFTYTTVYYNAFYVSDTWAVTKKLTVTAGLRYEIPGVYLERYDRLAIFNPNEPNPLLKNVSVLGHPVLGAFDLVNTPNHPDRGMFPEVYRLFSPRVGIAYRLTDKTVIRTGAGRFFIPSTVSFMPILNPDSYYVNQMVATIDKSVTFVNTLSDPYPGGLQQFPGRNPSYQQALVGASLNGGYSVGPVLGNEKRGYSYQWNFTVQHQFVSDIAFEAGYAGLRGYHLPLMGSQNGAQLNQLNPVYFSLGNQLNNQVPSPFYGIIPVGTLSTATVPLGQLLSPFPQYQGVQNVQANVGDSTYHALQVKVEKRFQSGGTILGSYTFSKLISPVNNAPSGSLDGINGGDSTIQNYYDLRSEKALADFDTRHRLVVSYVYDLPLGKGKRFLAGVKGAADKLVTGWGVNGVSSFQMGYPLKFSASPNVTGFNTGLRPNVAANCQQTISGPTQAKLNQYFNTACYSLPAPFTFGNEARTDPTLRAPGMNNFDLALFKRTSFTEGARLEFRVESFNLFNRVQFGPPNTAFTSAAGSTFGVITTQINQPRLLQMAMRLQF
jgi:hypothetical protein